MTSLELWCFTCIFCTFLALLSYVVILIRMEVAKHRASRSANVQPLKKMHPEKLIPRKDDREIWLEVLLFSLTAGVFLVFDVIFWLDNK